MRSRYIRYARAFDPKIKADGSRVLVDCYRQLRQQDTLGRNRSCYRITVRQLESLIRLSEALARLHLDDEVKHREPRSSCCGTCSSPHARIPLGSQVRPRYVLEAHRLLKTSIIHVEADDVVLDEEEGGGGGGGGGGGDDDDNDDFLRGLGIGGSGDDQDADRPRGGGSGEDRGDNPGQQQGADPVPQQRRQLTITNEKFKVRALVYFVPCNNYRCC